MLLQLWSDFQVGLGWQPMRQIARLKMGYIGTMISSAESTL